MKDVRVRSAVGAVAVLMLTFGVPAAHADNPFHCEASAVRATIGGQATVEPAVAGRVSECDKAQNTPAAAVPGLLRAQALVANTDYDGAAIRGNATGGVAQLAVAPTAEQLSQLPTQQAIDSLPAQSLSLPAPLADGLAAAGVPLPLQADLRSAVRALVPAPDTGLLRADVLTATASVGCAAGAVKLDGASRILGVKLAGQDVPLSGPVEQALALMSGGRIDPAQLDPSQVQILTPLNGVSEPLRRQLLDALGPALAQLPPLQLPASVADVKLVPNEQVRLGDALTQRALHATITVAGQPLLDAVFGEAKVSAATGACAAAVAAQGVADQILSCSDRKLVLVDVLKRGRRVKLLGAANRDYAGRRVAIRLRASGKVVARATVRKDGSFQTTAPRPPRALFATNRRSNLVRYRAEIGKEKSLPLKLQRRMIVSSLSSRDGKVTIAGRVVRPLTTPAAEVRLVRRVSCHKVVLVKRFKPRADGTFRVTVNAPKGQSAAVYRMTTRVREKLTNPRTYPTFTLPRGVALNTR